MAAWNSRRGNQCEGMRVAQPAVPFRGVIPAIGSPCGVRDDFDEVSKLCVEKTKEFSNLHYADGYSRYGSFIDFPKEIEVRANWDVEQPFSLGAK